MKTIRNFTLDENVTYNIVCDVRNAGNKVKEIQCNSKTFDNHLVTWNLICTNSDDDYVWQWRYIPVIVNDELGDEAIDVIVEEQVVTENSAISIPSACKYMLPCGMCDKFDKKCEKAVDTDKQI